MFVLVLFKAAATAALTTSLRSPPSMTSDMDTNGDTASLKRKRGPKDESALSQKKHRRRSTSTVQEDAANANDDNTSKSVALRLLGGDIDLADASSALSAGPVGGQLASWKVSKPMGGRMLDIDPVFSSDER